MNIYGMITGALSSSPWQPRNTLDVLRGNEALGSEAVCEYCEYLVSVNSQFSYLKELLYQQLS